jgi:hypothetical protein
VLNLQLQPPIPEASLRWQRGLLVAGHGVASGRAPGSPYPAGTIPLQRPFFRQLGLDLADCHPGTLNLAFAGGEWRLSQPAFQVEQLPWTPLHPPETFSFWPCRLRRPDATDAAQPAWIYWPHPETKQRHWQAPDRLEVLAPWMGGLAAGIALELGVDGRHCRLVQPARLRARLLEFLKFRVLAAQEEFFTGLGRDQDPAAMAAALRTWLAAMRWHEALDLSDADLLATLHAARHLYVN